MDLNRLGMSEPCCKAGKKTFLKLTVAQSHGWKVEGGAWNEVLKCLDREPAVYAVLIRVDDAQYIVYELKPITSSHDALGMVGGLQKYRWSQIVRYNKKCAVISHKTKTRPRDIGPANTTGPIRRGRMILRGRIRIASGILGP